nr:hypothetical protein [Tanacetum cinerariifolium]
MAIQKRRVTGILWERLELNTNGSHHIVWNNTSNTFEALNVVEEDVQEPSVQESLKLDEDAQNLKSVNEEAVKEKEQYSLWSKFKATKEASKSNPRTPMLDSNEESEVDEYPPYDSIVISSTCGGCSLDEEDLDCYNGYDTHVHDLTIHEQALCDQYDIRLNNHGRK